MAMKGTSSPYKPKQESYKFLIVGDDKVGKTSLVQAYAMGDPLVEKDAVTPTYNFEEVSADKSLKIHGNKVRIYLHEHKGGDPLRPSYSEFDGIFLMFALDKPKTFEALTAICEEMLSHVPVELRSKSSCVLLGNKLDLVEKVGDSDEEKFKSWAERKTKYAMEQFKYYETSFGYYDLEKAASRAICQGNINHFVNHALSALVREVDTYQEELKMAKQPPPGQNKVNASIAVSPSSKRLVAPTNSDIRVSADYNRPGTSSNPDSPFNGRKRTHSSNITAYDRLLTPSGSGHPVSPRVSPRGSGVLLAAGCNDISFLGDSLTPNSPDSGRPEESSSDFQETPKRSPLTGRPETSSSSEGFIVDSPQNLRSSHAHVSNKPQVFRRVEDLIEDDQVSNRSSDENVDDC